MENTYAQNKIMLNLNNNKLTKTLNTLVEDDYTTTKYCKRIFKENVLSYFNLT